MPTAPTITLISPETKTMDRTPTFRWSFSETEQVAFQVKVEIQNEDTSYTQVIPENTGIPFEVHSGLDKAAQEYTLSKSLSPGTYRISLMAKSATNDWSVLNSDSQSVFTIVIVNDYVIGWDTNRGTEGTTRNAGTGAWTDGSGTPNDNGFEEWDTGAGSGDITTNPERMQIREVNPEGFMAGSFILQHDGGYDNMEWETVQWESVERNGSSIEVYAKVGATQDEVVGADFGDVIINGGDITGQGRWLMLRVRLIPSLDAATAPILKRMTVMYNVPSVTETERTFELKVDPTATPPVNGFKDVAIPGDNTEAGDAGVTLKRGTPLVEYSLADGTLVIRHDARALAQYDGVRLKGSLPTGTRIRLQVRAFNNALYAENSLWQTVYDSTVNTGTAYLDRTTWIPLTIHRKRYLDVKVLLNTQDSAKEQTPVVNILDVAWTRIIASSETFYYTEDIPLPSNISRILLTANTEEPDGCIVEYALGTGVATETWEKAQPLALNRWVDTITEPSGHPFIVTKLTSGSDVTAPVVYDLNMRIHTEADDVMEMANDRTPLFESVDITPTLTVDVEET